MSVSVATLYGAQYKQRGDFKVRPIMHQTARRNGPGSSLGISSPGLSGVGYHSKLLYHGWKLLRNDKIAELVSPSLKYLIAHNKTTVVCSIDLATSRRWNTKNGAFPKNICLN